VDWSNRAQFFGLAARMMRRVLLNHARSRRAGKRGRDALRTTLSAAEPACLPRAVDLLALDAALDRLAALDPRKAQVVELKFFGGLTAEEIAELLHLSAATIDREWSFARAWLSDAVGGAGPCSGAEA
jgi:RNA polymerase sigma factor (TIGR02999 family)